ncbi:Serine protease family S08A [Phytophthora palmivora]|uniref:Serine protease family S08A n=1 Tax=Phytophthora palmivora TaxID=4796 RepID=A0A2P4Y8N5_9STRA|nr:Serine protease family S08A [Phytophthora palmivora]
MALLVLAAATMALCASDEAKVSVDLLQTVRSDSNARVDVLVQLTSPSQALQDSCDRSDSEALDHGQRASCVAESLQKFAEETQQPVKDLLDQHNGLYDSSTFLWISNSVAVKGACGELVMALAQLDTVEKIETEQVFMAPTDGEIFAAESTQLNG